MIKDNYNAKYELWVKSRKVISDRKTELPFKFGHKVFSSYEEFNKWKRNILLEIAEYGGVQWKK